MLFRQMGGSFFSFEWWIYQRIVDAFLQQSVISIGV